MSESAHSQFEISLCAGSLAAKYQEYLHFLSGIPHGNGVALHSRKGSVLLVVGADLSTDGAGFLLLPIIVATDRRSSRGQTDSIRWLYRSQQRKPEASSSWDS